MATTQDRTKLKRLVFIFFIIIKFIKPTQILLGETQIYKIFPLTGKFSSNIRKRLFPTENSTFSFTNFLIKTPIFTSESKQ